MSKGAIAGGALLGLTAIFLYDYLAESWVSILEGPQSWNGASLVGACLLYLIYYLYQGNQWRMILRDFGESVSLGVALKYYLTANLLAYIPGKIAAAAGVVALAHREKISSWQMGGTWFCFQVYTLVSLGVVLVLGELVLERTVLHLSTWWVVGITFAAAMILVSPPVSSLVRRGLSRWLPQEPYLNKLSLPRHLWHVVVFSVSWGLKLGIFFLLFQALSEERVGFEDGAVIGLLSLAGYLVGRLVFLVPAGLGVMETGIVVWLSTHYPQAFCTWYVSLFRVVTILVLVVSWLLVVMVRRSDAERASGDAQG